MALGTITRIAADPRGISDPVAVGDLKMTVTTVVGDGAYATAGTTLAPAKLGLTTVFAAICTVSGSASNNGAIAAQYIASTQKLVMFAGAGTSPNIGLAAPNSVNLSGLTVQIVAFGY